MQKYKQLKIMTGAVLDKEGPVLEGEIKVADSAGKVVATTRLENSKNYRVEIPAGTTLPIVLTANPEGSSNKLTEVSQLLSS